MHKKFKDCKLKGLILSTIRSGKNTGKTIYPAIQFPHHIDSLYTELNFLRRYGYITAKKTGKISTYSLTKKGQQHALTPDLFKRLKYERINKKASAMASAEYKELLNNNEKFQEEVAKYAEKLRPYVESPDSHVMYSNPETKIEFLDMPQSDPRIEKIKEMLDAHNQDKPIDHLKNLDLNQQKANVIDTNQDAEIEKLNAKIKELEKSNEFLNNERQNLKKQLISQSPVFDPVKNPPANTVPASYHPHQSSQYMSESYVGDDGKIHQRKNRIPNPPTEDEKQRKNRRISLARQYKNYTLDKNFFMKWSNGNLRPILTVKDRQGKQRLDILSINNTMLKQNMDRIDYYEKNRIEELGLYIDAIHATGITVRTERSSNFRKVLEW